MNKKADLIMENVVKAVLFSVLVIAVLVILAMWWNSYRSQGIYPATRSVNAIVKASYKLDNTSEELTRKVAIETNNFFIMSFNNNPELCKDKYEESLNCLCVCNNQDCNMAYKNPNKYCRVMPYPSTINIGQIENVKTYEVRIEENTILISLA